LTCNNLNDFYEFKEEKASSMGIYFYFFIKNFLKYKDLYKEDISKIIFYIYLIKKISLPEEKCRKRKLFS